MEKEVIVYNDRNFTRYPEAKKRSERVYFTGWVKKDNKLVKIRFL